MSNITYPELPDGWEWKSGNRSESYYTRWFGTKDVKNGYESEVYWDDPGDHTVQIYPILGIRDDGNPEVSETVERYDTEQEAIDAVPILVAELEDTKSELSKSAIA